MFSVFWYFEIFIPNLILIHLKQFLTNFFGKHMGLSNFCLFHSIVYLKKSLSFAFYVTMLIWLRSEVWSEVCHCFAGLETSIANKKYDPSLIIFSFYLKASEVSCLVSGFRDFPGMWSGFFWILPGTSQAFSIWNFFLSSGIFCFSPFYFFPFCDGYSDVNVTQARVTWKEGSSIEKKTLFLRPTWRELS